MIDFLDFYLGHYHWPAFNIADSAICVGAVLFLLINIFDSKNSAIEETLMKIAVLFPGQGSQYLGMGQEFINTDTECASLLAMAEAACELNLGALSADGPMEELTRATNLQPAITITNLICWQAFKKTIGSELEVSCFAGHSLGEYSALCAAGVINAEDTMRLVRKRGALMEREGSMQTRAACEPF